MGEFPERQDGFMKGTILKRGNESPRGTSREGELKLYAGNNETKRVGAGTRAGVLPVTPA